MERQAVIPVDARGLRCPLPVLRLRRVADGLPPGSIIDLVADDPAAAVDIPAFARERGWPAPQVVREGAAIRFRIVIAARS